MLRWTLALGFKILLVCGIFASPLSASEFWKQLTPFSELQFARWVQSRVQIGPTSVAVAVQEVEMLRMKDGVRLRTSVYRPDDGGSFPTILVRTPYNRVFGGVDAFGYRGIAEYYLPKGYAVVIQTIRGKYDSEGIYRLLSSGEMDDGYETVEWISKQSWCDGNIAIMGVSHDGFTALAAGIRRPSGLKLILAGGAPADLRVDAFLINATVTTGLIDYILFVEKEIGPVYDQLFYDKYLSKVLHEPRLKLHDNIVQNTQLRLWDQLVTQLNKPQSTYWKQRRIRDRFDQINVPVVHIAGLFGDGDMPDTVKNYLALRSDPNTADQQRLILGWWDHGGSGPYGDASNVTPYLLSRINAYLDFYLKGQNSPLLNEKRVQFFSKGQEEWIYSNDYPLEKTKTVEFFLTANGKLSKTKSANSGTDSYKSDPEVVPTFIVEPSIDDAPDHKVYFSDPFTKNFDLLGDANLRLFLSTDTKDADFYSLLFKRTAAGQDELISSLIGAVQGRYRNGSYNAPVTMNPGQIYELNLPVTAVSAGIKKGERLGIILLSNLNPILIRNANTGKKIGKDTSFDVANIQIHHGAPYPSSLTLTTR
jgi:putative CocE/NonD family hydrolase